MRSFDVYTSTKRNSPVALLLDRASCHGSEENISVLKNVSVLFFPANNTSFLHPIDGGIIDCIKRRYHRKQVLSALTSNDPDMNQIYYLDQLTAMKWIYEICNELDSNILFNCWMKTGLADKNVNKDNSQIMQSTYESEKAEIIDFLKKSLPVQHYMHLHELLQPHDEC